MIRYSHKLMLVLVAVLASAVVHADAKGEIAYRQGAFKVVGGHMSSMVAILRGQVKEGNFALHAQGMADIAQVIPSVFPEGSGVGKTGALAKIWEDKAGFQKAMDDFTAAADGLAAAVAGGDRAAVGGAFRKLGGACKGCHDNYREEH